MEKVGVLVSPALPGIWVPFGGRGEPEGWRGAARGARRRAEGHGGAGGDRHVGTFLWLSAKLTGSVFFPAVGCALYSWVVKSVRSS